MKHMSREGDQVVISVVAIEFREGGNTLWIHGQGGTVLRFKTLNGVITSKSCQSPISHGDAFIQGDLEICLADDATLPPMTDGTPMASRHVPADDRWHPAGKRGT